MNLTLTSDLVRSFAGYMIDRFDANLIRKTDAFEMRAVGWFLDSMGILDKTRFMHGFATTLGRRIYLPFEPGDMSLQVSLWSQVVTIVHECQHVYQYDLLGPTKFTYKYLGSTAGRTALEVEAYSTAIELEWWRTGRKVAPEPLAQLMKDYAVSALDIKVAEVALRCIAETVWRGAVVTVASRAAINWFERYGGMYDE